MKKLTNLLFRILEDLAAPFVLLAVISSTPKDRETAKSVKMFAFIFLVHLVAAIVLIIALQQGIEVEGGKIG